MPADPVGDLATVSRPCARVATVIGVDSRPLVRAGLSAVLHAHTQIELCAVCRPKDIFAAIEHHLPAVLVLSLSTGQPDPWRTVTTAKRRHPAMRVLILTDAASMMDLREGVRVGVDSFLLSDVTPEVLTDGVLATARGDRAVSPEVALQLAGAWHEVPGGAARRLTPRELEVVQRLADGLTNQQIGDALGLSARTVKTHVQHLLAKLDCSDRTGAVATAFRRGLIR